jgi:hypothetical protein
MFELTCGAPGGSGHLAVTGLVCPGCGHSDIGYECVDCTALHDAWRLVSAA